MAYRPPEGTEWITGKRTVRGKPITAPGFKAPVEVSPGRVAMMTNEQYEAWKAEQAKKAEIEEKLQMSFGTLEQAEAELERQEKVVEKPSVEEVGMKAGMYPEGYAGEIKTPFGPVFGVVKKGKIIPARKTEIGMYVHTITPEKHTITKILEGKEYGTVTIPLKEGQMWDVGSIEKEVMRRKELRGYSTMEGLTFEEPIVEAVVTYKPKKEKFGLGLAEWTQEQLKKIKIEPKPIKLSTKPTRAERFIELYPQVTGEVIKGGVYGAATFLSGMADIGVSFIKNPLWTFGEVKKGFIETGYRLAYPIAGILRPDIEAARPTPERVTESAWAYGQLIGTVTASYAVGKAVGWAKKQIQKKISGFKGLTKEEMRFLGIDKLSAKEKELVLKQLEAIKKGKTQPTVKDLEPILKEMPRLKGRYKEVLEFLQGEDGILGGSAGVKTQIYGKTRIPHDLDYYTNDPYGAARRLLNTLNKEGKVFKLSKGTEIRLISTGKKVAEFHPVEVLTSHPFYTGTILTTPEGVRVISLYEQLLRKVPSAITKPARARKDLADILAGVKTTKERMRIEAETGIPILKEYKEWKLGRFEEALSGIRFGGKGYAIYPKVETTAFPLIGLPTVYPTYPKEKPTKYPTTIGDALYPITTKTGYPKPTTYPTKLIGLPNINVMAYPERKPTKYPVLGLPDVYPTFKPTRYPTYPGLERFLTPTYPITRKIEPPSWDILKEPLWPERKVKKKRKVKEKKYKPKTKYTPSLIGLSLPVYGKPGKILTGLEIRPIPMKIGFGKVKAMKTRKTKKKKGKRKDIASVLIGW